MYLISCGTSAQKEEVKERIDSKTNISAIDSNPLNKVIFFHLSEQEFDSVAGLPDYQGLYEVSSDFGFYVSKVMDSLKNTSVVAELTTDRVIEINNKAFDKFDEYGYGLVLIRPDSIRIEGGIMTDVEYFQLISEFFEEL